MLRFLQRVLIDCDFFSDVDLQYQWKYLFFCYFTLQSACNKAHLLLFFLPKPQSIKSVMGLSIEAGAVMLLADYGLSCNYLCWHILQP